MQAVKATDEDDQKADNTNRDDSPRELRFLVLDHGPPDAHAVVKVVRLRKCRVDVEFAFWKEF